MVVAANYNSGGLLKKWNIPMHYYLLAIAIAIPSGVSIYKIAEQQPDNLLLLALAFTGALLIGTWGGIIGYLIFRIDPRPIRRRPEPFVSDPRPSMIGINAHWQLHDALTELFSVSEIKDLMLMLDINEEWPNVAKSEMVTNLIMYLWKRDQLDSLYEAVNSERPQLKLE